MAAIGIRDVTFKIFVKPSDLLTTESLCSMLLAAAARSALPKSGYVMLDLEGKTLPFSTSKEEEEAVVRAFKTSGFLASFFAIRNGRVEVTTPGFLFRSTTKGYEFSDVTATHVVPAAGTPQDMLMGFCLAEDEKSKRISAHSMSGSSGSISPIRTM